MSCFNKYLHNGVDMSTSKPWDRPWSMEEIIENSDNWNLAGDVALLNTLKAFADNLLTRTTEINNNLQNLTSTLSETSLQLDIAQNEFQSLRNSQFIESRVYEDDETLEATGEAKAEEEKEVDKTEEVRLAALKGLEVLEKYFDRVEVSVSDSEDDDIDLPNYVLRPKDLYIDRPLPYVIGSEEWHRTWHVGLEDSSSGSETEKVSDNFSESDSESDLPIIPDRTQIKDTSETSSELDLRTEPKNFINSSDSENSVAVQAVGNFAEELAAKLGHVIDQEYAEPEVNRRPIQTKPQYDNLFFDEPPPLDEPKGLFSGGKGLFDDDDEATPPTPKPELRQPPKKDLFDGDESDDEIFTKKNPYLQKPAKIPLFSDEPPALDDKKKPVGGVSIFGGGDLFDKKLLRRQPSSDEEQEPETKGRSVNLFGSDEEESSESGLFNKIEPKVEETPKKMSLFDDNDDLFKDDLFSSTAPKKFTSGLFDDDLFATQPETKNSADLFADLMAIPDDKNSINVDSRETQKEAEPPKPKPRPSLFEPDDLFASEAPPTQTSTPQKASIPDVRLFDPNPPPDDNWDTTTDEFETTNQIQEEESNKSDLFSEEPPPLVINKPGKLKHDLKINVGALRPGAFPPKQTDGATKSPPSFDEADNVTVLPSVTKDRARRPLNRRPSTRKGRKEALKKSESDFQLEQENDPTSRDPIFEVKSSRNDSNLPQGNLNQFEEPPDDDLFDTKSQKTDIHPNLESRDTFVQIKPNLGLFDEPPDDDLFANSDTNIMKESTGLFDEPRDDILDIRRDSPKQDSHRSFGLFDEPPDDLFEVKSETKPKSDLFEEEFGDSRDIFEGNKTKSGLGLFGERSDDDLFGSRGESEVKSDESRDIPKSSQVKTDIFGDEDDDDLFNAKKTPIQGNKAKKSLFDDDEDDDDIFKSFTSASVKKSETKVATEKKVPKVSSIKKLENTKPDDDPLSALLK
ncbi:WASH complex subunit 2 isoform X2 [Tribolium madens]|uniref:WASH complex subunit 2 isoform X2 n=1 Tax=Tribolium madens TaxID=41895 RepID=UPI001CF763D7|nr:WASH complex subunit 2 isoform X2 [Tribolium madens]